MPKPDDRSNNVERLQQMVENTKENIEAANESLENTMSAEQQEQIREKNKRREESIQSFQNEIEDEKAYRQSHE
ncbi:small acid-soluble spore protein Tlp [Fictibacillus sp. Mic-4]|uniref:small acid-soluble spore protein Tlp n=1 Tax=Fictibacillus TaxID=1329200 RepID=UPI00040A8E11|nr:small acid-soluble spore protein Tlp [Fictibacillus gelatini]